MKQKETKHLTPWTVSGSPTMIKLQRHLILLKVPKQRKKEGTWTAVRDASQDQITVQIIKVTVRIQPFTHMDLLMLIQPMLGPGPFGPMSVCYRESSLRCGPNTSHIGLRRFLHHVCTSVHMGTLPLSFHPLSGEKHLINTLSKVHILEPMLVARSIL